MVRSEVPSFSNTLAWSWRVQFCEISFAFSSVQINIFTPVLLMFLMCLLSRNENLEIWEWICIAVAEIPSGDLLFGSIILQCSSTVPATTNLPRPRFLRVLRTRFSRDSTHWMGGVLENLSAQWETYLQSGESRENLEREYLEIGIFERLVVAGTVILQFCSE